MVSLKALALVIGGLVAAGGAVANAIWGPRARARRRLLQGRTTIADREIVTLSGTVRQRGELLVAPLSGKECVLYDSYGHVKELRGNSRYADSVAELREQKLPPTPVVPRRIEREKAFLEAHGQPFKLVVASGFDEARVAPGDRVSVQGMAIIELDPTASDERGYRENAPRKIRLVAHDAHPLTIGRVQRR